ncbi:aldose epimerase family protein [Rossellomorea vietnamensis]|uniref:aldose epimerase family protein n=1 Tax=Rossellomorea vietnamensis TaxID=218284 RepID=UPI003CF65512
MEIIQQEFGRIGEQAVTSFTLKNANGIEITAINYGCIITKIITPDQNGNFENIVIGHDSLKDYVEDPVFLGAVVGRVGGRIRGGAFELDGKAYTLPQNNGRNHLHGGLQGFNKVVWQADILVDGVRFTYLSKDGEEGYPGSLHSSVTYTLDDHDQLKISYEARTDKKTVVTLTNHSYFNLSGSLKRDVLQHILTIKSDEFLELDEESIPTGRMLSVDHTPFDLRQGASIDIGAKASHPQIVLAGEGYDHPFVLNTNNDREIRLEDPESGRVMTVETDEPAVVVYSGNSLDGAGPFSGTPGAKHLGICLETQAFPDAVHHPEFPSVVLTPDKKYSSVTKYTFEIQ